MAETAKLMSPEKSFNTRYAGWMFLQSQLLELMLVC